MLDTHLSDSTTICCNTWISKSLHIICNSYTAWVILSVSKGSLLDKPRKASETCSKIVSTMIVFAQIIKIVNDNKHTLWPTNFKSQFDLKQLKNLCCYPATFSPEHNDIPSFPRTVVSYTTRNLLLLDWRPLSCRKLAFLFPAALLSLPTTWAKSDEEQ